MIPVMLVDETSHNHPSHDGFPSEYNIWIYIYIYIYIYMDTYGYVWIYMDIYGYIWGVLNMVDPQVTIGFTWFHS